VASNIDAKALNVTSLSALTANLGNVTSGAIKLPYTAQTSEGMMKGFTEIGPSGFKVTGNNLGSGYPEVAYYEMGSNPDSGLYLSHKYESDAYWENVYMDTVGVTSILGTNKEDALTSTWWNIIMAANKATILPSWRPISFVNGFSSTTAQYLYLADENIYLFKGAMNIPSGYTNSKVAFSLPGPLMGGQYNGSQVWDTSGITTQNPGYLLPEDGGTVKYYQTVTGRKAVGLTGLILAGG